MRFVIDGATHATHLERVKLLLRVTEARLDIRVGMPQGSQLGLQSAELAQEIEPRQHDKEGRRHGPRDTLNDMTGGGELGGSVRSTTWPRTVLTSIIARRASGCTSLTRRLLLRAMSMSLSFTAASTPFPIQEPTRPTASCFRVSHNFLENLFQTQKQKKSITVTALCSLFITWHIARAASSCQLRQLPLWPVPPSLSVRQPPLEAGTGGR